MDDGRNSYGHARGFIPVSQAKQSMPTLEIGEIVEIKGVQFKVEWMRKRGLKLIMQASGREGEK